MIKQDIKLDDLYTDSGLVNEDEIAPILYPFIAIQKSTSEIFFKENNLTSEEKIMAYALTKKLLKHKEVIEVELISASEIAKKIGLKKGTVDPSVKKLKDRGILIGKGSYEIPVHQISTVIKQLKNKIG